MDAKRRSVLRSFCPSAFFSWLGLIQVFNQNSPSILYGLLGFKVYFYYVPLLFAGYALIRTDGDLQEHSWWSARRWRE